jgi:AcrR family transcriptional regulator
MIVMKSENSTPEPSDTCLRILEAATRLYRLIGHRKTSVADIARESSMSPANVYRFFRSKQAINDAVADKLFEEVIVVAVEASHTPGTAAERLRATLAAIEQRHADRFISERKLHELVAISVRENWSISRSFRERIESIVAEIISDGKARGEFQSGDSMTSGRCLLAATTVFCDPRLMSTIPSFGRPTLEQMMDFAIGALRADSTAPCTNDHQLYASREMVRTG